MYFGKCKQQHVKLRENLACREVLRWRKIKVRAQIETNSAAVFL